MTDIRSLLDPYKFQTQTENILRIPNKWGLTEQLGIFTKRGVSSLSVLVSEESTSVAVIEDKIRGERRPTLSGDSGRTHSFAIGHFPIADAVYPQDLQDRLVQDGRFGGLNKETVANVVAKKLAKIRNSYALTHEIARMQTIVTGQSFAPNGTISYDWYSEFGQTRETVYFELSNTATNTADKVEEVIAYLQDSTYVGIVEDFIAICSPEFFSALIRHPKVEEAFKYYEGNQRPILRERLTASGYDARYREFFWHGVLFIEYRGFAQKTIGGTKEMFIPAGKAYAMPLSKFDEDSFVTYFAPAQKFSDVNTLGQELYAWTYKDTYDEQIMMHGESNFLNVLRRPELILELDMGTA